MAYKIKVKPLTKKQSRALFETLRNEIDLKGDEIMKLRRRLREKKLLKKFDFP